MGNLAFQSLHPKFKISVTGFKRSNEAAQDIRFHIHYATPLPTLQYLLVTVLLLLHTPPYYFNINNFVSTSGLFD
jgi:hypothetical protein